MKDRILESNRHGSRQRGAAALEFALVLPVLLFLIYGVVVYGYLFIVQSSMTFAAQAGAQSAVAVDPLDENFNDIVVSNSRQAAARILSWLPDSQRDAIVGDATGSTVTVDVSNDACPAIGGSDFVCVRLTYNMPDGNFFIPAFNLGALQIPPLPDRLVGASSAVL